MNLIYIFPEIHQNLIENFSVEINKTLNSDTVYSNDAAIEFNELWLNLKRLDIQNSQIQLNIIMRTFNESKLNNNI